jgi:hypothetical protein
MITPYMSLTIPTVGSSGTSGPQYAIDINQCLQVLDAHDHTPGNGQQIPVEGLNINDNLDLGGYALIGVDFTTYSAQSAPLSELTSVYVVNDDLYYTDGQGNQIRLTLSGQVNTAAGNISGLSAPATAAYVAGTGTFVWESNTNVAATMDFGSFIIRDMVASGNGVTVSVPSGLSADYSLTLPGSLPSGAAGLLLTNNSGTQTYLNRGAANTVLRVNSGGTNIEYSTIDTANITDEAVTAAKIEEDVDLVGDVMVESRRVLTSVSHPTGSPNPGNLVTIGGFVSSTGTILSGTGFTVNKSGTGAYDITFTTPFDGGVVSCVASCSLSGGLLRSAMYSNLNTTTLRINTWYPSVSVTTGIAIDSDFSFIIVGCIDL